MEIHRPDQEVVRGSGIASVTYMNRGHALMERIRVPEIEGHALSSMAFIATDGKGSWTVGEGDNWSEAIGLWSGTFIKTEKEAGKKSGKKEGTEKLVLHDAVRPGGGANLMLMRRTYEHLPSGEGSPEQYRMTLDVSTDLGSSWNLVMKRGYTRRSTDEAQDLFPVREDHGLPDPERAPEASQFDFLIGHFEATHWLKQPQRELRWTADATAVHALNGHGILEFNWNDKDPSLPDAATSILRVYNRAMRQWESLYLTNRSNVPLYFGGVQEGERIVLHPFGAQTSSRALSQWIFFNMEKDSYQWKGLRAAHRGVELQPTWTIDFARREVEIPAKPSLDSRD